MKESYLAHVKTDEFLACRKQSANNSMHQAAADYVTQLEEKHGKGKGGNAALYLAAYQEVLDQQAAEKAPAKQRPVTRSLSEGAAAEVEGVKTDHQEAERTRSGPATVQERMAALAQSSRQTELRRGSFNDKDRGTKV